MYFCKQQHQRAATEASERSLSPTKKASVAAVLAITTVQQHFADP